jgi:regulator of chromosome condensation
VPKPDSVDGTQFYTTEELEMTPAVVPKLEKEGFRAVRVAGGDSVSVAISDVGQMKVWGSFRVGLMGGESVCGDRVGIVWS